MGVERKQPSLLRRRSLGSSSNLRAQQWGEERLLDEPKECLHRRLPPKFKPFLLFINHHSDLKLYPFQASPTRLFV